MAARISFINGLDHEKKTPTVCTRSAQGPSDVLERYVPQLPLRCYMNRKRSKPALRHKRPFRFVGYPALFRLQASCRTQTFGHGSDRAHTRPTATAGRGQGLPHKRGLQRRGCHPGCQIMPAACVGLRSGRPLRYLQTSDALQNFVRYVEGVQRVMSGQLLR